MVTKARDWPDVYGEFRNNLAVIVNRNIELLMAIHINKLSDTEEIMIETVIQHQIKMREGLLAAGAKEQPLIEIAKIAHNLPALPAQTR